MPKKSKQLVFIDESGDPGFKIGPGGGSSALFVIACVVFDDKCDARNVNSTINELKTEIGWDQNYEFKFHRTSDRENNKFFAAMQKMDFKVWATIVDKRRILNSGSKNSGLFYQKVIVDTLSHISGLSDVEIFLDGKGGKNYRKESTTIIRKTLRNSGVTVAKFRFEDSQKNNLIQLADMVAEVIRSQYDPKESRHKNYLKMFEDQIVGIYEVK